MHSKICIKLPKIKSDCQDRSLLDLREISRTPTGYKLKDKKMEILHSLNNIRLASLTPEIIADQKRMGKIYSSPKLKEMLNLKSIDSVVRKRSRLKQTIMKILKQKDLNEETERECQELNIPSRFHVINIKQLLQEARKKYSERCFESRTKLYRWKYDVNKDMIQYYKF